MESREKYWIERKRNASRALVDQSNSVPLLGGGGSEPTEPHEQHELSLWQREPILAGSPRKALVVAP